MPDISLLPAILIISHDDGVIRQVDEVQDLHEGRLVPRRVCSTGAVA
jgi:hypothetical protein